MKGSCSHSIKGLYVKRFRRSMDARVDKDQPALERWCSHLSRRMAMRAVQIWMRSAFSLVPTNVFTLRFCFRALKNSSTDHLSL